MKVNDIFNLEQYSEAISFVDENNGLEIVEIEPRNEKVKKTRLISKVDEKGNLYYEEEIYEEMELVRYFQIVESAKKTLEELKEAKREEINQARDEAEQGGFEYMGKVFDSDQVSCIRMMGASQSLANAPTETTITWTCQDNSTIDLNGTQFAGLVVALATHSNTCHQKATELKAQIEKATSAEELEGLKWNQA